MSKLLKFIQQGELCYHEYMSAQIRLFCQSSTRKKLEMFTMRVAMLIVGAFALSVYPLGLASILVPGMHLHNAFAVALILLAVSLPTFAYVRIKGINLYSCAIYLAMMTVVSPQLIKFDSIGSFIFASLSIESLTFGVHLLAMYLLSRVFHLPLRIGFLNTKQPWIFDISLGSQEKYT